MLIVQASCITQLAPFLQVQQPFPAMQARHEAQGCRAADVQSQEAAQKTATVIFGPNELGVSMPPSALRHQRDKITTQTKYVSQLCNAEY